MAVIVLPEGADVVPEDRFCDVQLRPIPEDVPTDLMRAVEAFRRDLRVGYGVDLPVVVAPAPIPDDSPPNRIEIVVEARAPMDTDRTQVSFPAADRMRITGGESGVRRTLFRLLEEFGGARFLFQGRPDDIGLGAHFPERSSLAIPRKTLKYDSAFPLERRSPRTTYLSHLPGPRNRTYFWNWEARVGGSQGLDTSHNLPFIAFPVADYIAADEKPDEDIFPILQGRRFLPWEQFDADSGGAVRGHWQPRFSSPAAVDEAVRNILAHLRRYPRTRTLSLAVNDNGGHCETEIDPDYPLNNNPRLVKAHYRWVNAVAERVTDVHPDIMFGVTAYREVEPAPPFKLHPNVVCVLAFDHHGCMDPEVRARRKRLIRDWAKVAKIGNYTYNGGISNFSLPRLYMREMQRMLQVLHENGAVSVFHERAYNQAPEGPKLYVFHKLMEDPYRDLETLIREWCDAAVGPEAGAVLREYYAFWEDFWRHKAIHTNWWKSGKHNIYMTLGQFGSYMYALASGDMARCRVLMERVVEKARAHGTPDQSARAALLMQFFEWYESMATAALAEYFAADGSIPDADAAVALLRSVPAAQAALENARRLPEAMADWIAPNLMLQRLRGSDPVANALAAVSAHFDDPQVVAELHALSENTAVHPRFRFLAGLMHDSAVGDDSANLVDGAFKASDHGWETVFDRHGTVSLSETHVFRGTHALKGVIQHPNYTIHKVVSDVQPFTQHYFAARIFLPEDQPVTEGYLNLRGSPAQRVDGRIRNRGHTRNVPDIRLTPGQWNYVSCIIPANNRDATDHVVMRIIMRSFEPGDVFYVDDVTLVPIVGVEE